MSTEDLGKSLQAGNAAWSTFKGGKGLWDLWNSGASWGDLFSSGAGGLASLGAGYGLSQLAGQRAHNAGGMVGGAVGSLLGNAIPIPVLGSFAGGQLGTAIGGLIGPRKSKGPGGTFAIDAMGRPMGVSGDNGWTGNELAGPGMAGYSALRGLADQFGGSLNMQAMQFGQQPLQGAAQIAFTGLDGKRMGGGDWMGNGGYNLSGDDFLGDTVRSALGAGALQVSPDARARIYELIGGEQSPASARAQRASDAHDAWLLANRLPFIQGASAAGETAGDAGAAF